MKKYYEVSLSCDVRISGIKTVVCIDTSESCASFCELGDAGMEAASQEIRRRLESAGIEYIAVIFEKENAMYTKRLTPEDDSRTFERGPHGSW